MSVSRAAIRCDRPYLFELVNSKDAPRIFTMRSSFFAVTCAIPSIPYNPKSDVKDSECRRHSLDRKIMV